MDETTRYILFYILFISIGFLGFTIYRKIKDHKDKK